MTRPGIAIVDYGMGNLRSVQKAVESAGGAASVVADPAGIEGASGLVLPGVGAFRDAMERLRSQDLVGPILTHIAAGRPFLGLCLGLQLLFSEGEEFGIHAGLDVIPGRVVRFSPGKKVPHMGWNTISIRKPNGILEGIPDGSWFYFVHSFYGSPSEEGWVGAVTEYEELFPSVVARDNVFACQFHPEKSQEMGLAILRNFIRLAGGRE